MKFRNNVSTVYIRDSIDSSASVEGKEVVKQAPWRLLGSSRFPEAVPLALEETHRTGTVCGK